MTASLDMFRCQHCKRVLCACFLPVGGVLRVRCRDCKSVSEFSAVPAPRRVSLSESYQHIATVARLTGR